MADQFDHDKLVAAGKEMITKGFIEPVMELLENHPPFGRQSISDRNREVLTQVLFNLRRVRERFPDSSVLDRWETNVEAVEMSELSDMMEAVRQIDSDISTLSEYLEMP